MIIYNRKKSLKKLNNGNLIEDDELVHMIYDIGIAIEICRSIPGYNLATNALYVDLLASVRMAQARNLMIGYPDAERMLFEIHQKYFEIYKLQDI